MSQIDMRLQPISMLPERAAELPTNRSTHTATVIPFADRLKRSSASWVSDAPGLVSTRSAAKDVGACESPLSAVRDCRAAYSKIERGHRAAVRAVLQEIAVIAAGFERSPAAWESFVRDRFWDHMTKRDRPKPKGSTYSVAAYVTRFVLRARKTRMIKRAWKYARVVDHLLSQGIRPSSIASAIKSGGGIEKVYRAAVRATPRQTKSAGQGETCATKPKMMTKKSASVSLRGDQEPAEAGGLEIVWGKKALRLIAELPVGGRSTIAVRKLADAADGRIRIRLAKSKG